MIINLYHHKWFLIVFGYEDKILDGGVHKISTSSRISYIYISGETLNPIH